MKLENSMHYLQWFLINSLYNLGVLVRHLLVDAF